MKYIIQFYKDDNPIYGIVYRINKGSYAQTRIFEFRGEEELDLVLGLLQDILKHDKHR
jgi:hypothetical protein